MVTNSQDRQTDTFCLIHMVEVDKVEEYGDGC